MEAKVGKGEVKVLETGLPDDASDEEFVGYLKESKDSEMAVSSYASKFQDPKPNKRRSRKSAEDDSEE